jgi:hypothetical protein
MGALSSPANIGHRLASVPRPSRRSNADGRLIAPAADAATIQADSGGARPMPARPGGRPKRGAADVPSTNGDERI